LIHSFLRLALESETDIRLGQRKPDDFILMALPGMTQDGRRNYFGNSSRFFPTLTEIRKRIWQFALA
jgi:hypothetical protein